MAHSSQAAEDYRRDGWWRDETFLDDLWRQTGERPDKPILIGRRPGATDVITYAELAKLTDQIAHGLLDLGVRRDEFVVMQLPNMWAVLPIALACMRVGARLAPLMSVYGQREIEQMLRLTEARIFVTVTEMQGLRLAETAVELAKEVPTLEHVVVVEGFGDDRPAATLSFRDLFLKREDDDPAALEGRALGPDDPCLILFTSGTTGEAKGALHSQNTLYAGLCGYRGALDLGEDLVKVTPHTHNHYVGLVQTLIFPLHVGGTAVFAHLWEPEVYLDLIEEHGVTMFYAASSFVRELMEAQQAKPRDMSSLKFVVSGSAPVPPQMVEQVREILGTRQYSLWGMTENGPVAMTRPDDDPGWPAHSDGRPTGGMSIRIDPMKGRDDGVGALWVRGPAQCLGYYRREDAYAADLDEDGWFNTGDLARDDGRGGIRIAGRTKDVILYKSFNVPVMDVENVLGKHPGIRDIALIPITDETVVERVCAVITPQGEPPTLEELRDYLRDEGLSEWFWPAQLEIVDAMPRTATGKIRKVDLRARYDR
jgi:cyclohexanecarboxylate-CoA ligase